MTKIARAECKVKACFQTLLRRSRFSGVSPKIAFARGWRVVLFSESVVLSCGEVALSVGAVRAGFRHARGLSDGSENRPMIHFTEAHNRYWIPQAFIDESKGVIKQNPGY